MLVAQSTAIAFVPTKTLGTWLTKGGERNALDDFCDSVGPVVTWFGKWLRGWRVHSYSACDCSYCSPPQGYFRAEAALNELNY